MSPSPVGGSPIVPPAPSPVGGSPVVVPPASTPPPDDQSVPTWLGILIIVIIILLFLMAVSYFASDGNPFAFLFIFTLPFNLMGT